MRQLPCLFGLPADVNRLIDHIVADVIEESLPGARTHTFSSKIKKMAETDLINLPRPNLEELAGSHCDVETVDIVAGHVASFLVIDESVEGMALKGPHH